MVMQAAFWVGMTCGMVTGFVLCAILTIGVIDDLKKEVRVKNKNIDS